MVCWRRLPPSSRPSSLPLPSRPPASLPSPVDGGRKAPGALSPLTTYGMTSEWENVPRPRASSHSPHWNQIHIWSRGSGPGARGVVPALQRGDRKERRGKKKKKQARKKKAKCLLSVCLIVSLSASLCLWLSPQSSRARFLVPTLPFPAPAAPQDDSRPPPQPSRLPQREEGLLPRGPHLRLRGADASQSQGSTRL